MAFATDQPLDPSANRQHVATEGDVTVSINAPPGDRPDGPTEDAIRLEMAILDVREAGRRQIVLLRYDPDELLDPMIPADELQPVASGVAVQIGLTGEQLSIRRVDDWPIWIN